MQRYWWLISGKPKHHRAGRPRIDPSVEQIILDIKAENPRYGAERIAALVTEQLGVPVSESTVRNVLKRNPSPRSRPGQSWKTFLDNHRHLLTSMDFIRTAVGCPQQNGTVERFNRTLTEELLAHIIPIGDSHLNRLLGEFKAFYNSARPHQANKGLTPDQAEASNDEAFVPAPFDPESLRVEEIPWLAGLHHSYRRIA